jgi:hypothetical protein
MTPAIPVLYLLAAILQRRRPAVLVLRRFGVPQQDLLLVQDLAPSIATFARVWWLGDRLGVHPLTGVKHFTYIAGWSLFGIAGGTITLLRSDGWTFFEALGAASCVALVSWIVLESFASRRYGLPTVLIAAIGILLASDKIGLPSQMAPPPARGSPALFTAIVLGALWYRWRGDDAQVDVAVLEREARACFLLFPRYLLNAPVLASGVYPSESEWRAAVDRLARRSSAVVLDVTYLDDSADGLRWEIDLCQRLGVPCLYLCKSSEADRVRPTLLTLSRSDMPPSFLTYGRQGLPLPTIQGFLRGAVDRKPAPKRLLRDDDV